MQRDEAAEGWGKERRALQSTWVQVLFLSFFHRGVYALLGQGSTHRY